MNFIKTHFPNAINLFKKNSFNAHKIPAPIVYFNKKSEGQIMKVLFEKKAPNSKKSKANNKFQLWGKSPYLQSVIVDCEENDLEKFQGKIFDVKILHARPSSLVGEIC